MCRFGDAKACLPLPAGSKPTAGTFDWLETAIYQGQSSDLTGTPLDIWASSTEVSNFLYFYYASRYMTVLKKLFCREKLENFVSECHPKIAIAQKHYM